MYLNVDKELKDIEEFYDSMEHQYNMEKEMLNWALRHLACYYSQLKYNGAEIAKMNVEPQVYTSNNCLDEDMEEL